MSEFTHSASWEGSGFPIHEFPLAPNSVVDAYKIYWRSTNTPYSDRVTESRALREVNTYISDFCESYLTDQTYHAATLSQLMPKDQEPMTHALRALRIYRNESRDALEDQEFVFGLLTDQPIIDMFWQQQVDRQYASDTHIHHALTTRTPEAVPSELWLEMPLGTRAEDIMQLRTEYGVNIESFLIQAAKTLEWLCSPDALNNTGTLQQVNKARSMYVPFCEIIGFDGLAMALNSRCLELQLEFTGKGHYVDLSREIIDNMGTHDVVAARTHRILTAAFGLSEHDQVVGHGSKHGIVIGEGVCADDSLHSDELLRVVWRRKSLGSLALKLAQIGETNIDNGELPLDVIAATVVAPDTGVVGSAFRSMIERLQANPRVTLRPSPSRRHALHARGAEYYLNTIRQKLGYDSLEEMEQVIDVRHGEPGDYQVVKVTFEYQEYGEPFPTLVEIQFNTASDRIQARVGTPSHALHKLSGGEVGHIDTTALADLNAQKRFLGHNGLTSQSRERAVALMRRVDEISA